MAGVSESDFILDQDAIAPFADSLVSHRSEAASVFKSILLLDPFALNGTVVPVAP